MITVHTGLRPQAGTTSNVYLVLNGSEADSGIRMLSDGEEMVLITPQFVKVLPQC
jgi:hypothetical protein